MKRKTPNIVNLNQRVRVRIRPLGEKMWAKHYTDLDCPVPPIPTGQTADMQLWEVMSIFGSSMGIGFDLSIDPDIKVLE